MPESGDLPEGNVVVHVSVELEALIPKFLANRRGNVHTIFSALEAREYESIRVIGHNMKGVGSSYGFDRISVLGVAIENAAVTEKPHEITKLVLELSDYLDRVEVIFNSPESAEFH